MRKVGHRIVLAQNVTQEREGRARGRRGMERKGGWERLEGKRISLMEADKEDRTGG